MPELKIKDKLLKYTVTYRKVKYMRYEFHHGELKLIIPKGYSKNIIDCIYMKEEWLYKNLVNYEKETKKLDHDVLNLSLESWTLDDLKIIVNYYILEYENKLNVKTNRIQYRKTSTKWASCSSLNNVTFSLYLRYLPENLIAYIVYHELSHLLELNHSESFYNIIKKEYPDYLKYDDILKKYWYIITK